jgi:hypothetical protein
VPSFNRWGRDPLEADTIAQAHADAFPDSLLDLLAGLNARDAALAFVGERNGPEWRKAARFAVLVAATELPAFTTDDVWQVLATFGIGSPAEPREMGAVIRSLSSEHQIVGTGRYITSARPDAHARPIKEWKLVP